MPNVDFFSGGGGSLRHYASSFFGLFYVVRAGHGDAYCLCLLTVAMQDSGLCRPPLFT